MVRSAISHAHVRRGRVPVMSSGADRDTRELIRALKENTEVLKALKKQLSRLESLSSEFQELKREAFNKYMSPDIEPLVKGTCGVCSTGTCQLSDVVEKSNCGCCSKNHKR